MNHKLFIFCLLLPIICCVLQAPVIGNAKDRNVFSTWDVFEVDKCASAWLITRHINSEAKIIIYPRGSAKNKGIPFDTPTAKFRRYQNFSTYQTLLNHYKINDNKLNYIAKIVHDVEINIWDRKKYKESTEAKETVQHITSQPWSPEKKLEECMNYFEEMAERIGYEDK